MTSTGPTLAAMMTPGLAYAGLAAASIPIIIHLLNRRRFRIVRWAATDFLREAQRENRRRVRMEELILLALRCLAMALIGVALARWFVQPRTFGVAFGSNARTHQIIVLDDSYSMGLRKDSIRSLASAESPSGVTPQTVFEDAKSAVLRIGEQVRKYSPQDALTVLLTSHPDKPLLAGVTVSQTTPQSLIDALTPLRSSHRGSGLAGALEMVRDAIQENRAFTETVVHLVSDFQAIDWQPGSGGQRGQGTSSSSIAPAAILRSAVTREHDLQVVLVDVGHEVGFNRCVTAIKPEQAQPVVGVAGRYTVSVVSFGSGSAPACGMKAFIGEAALPPVGVPAIGPNQSVEVPLEVAFGEEGSQRLSVELDGDLLAEDNVRSAAVSVERALRVLLVDGEASPDPYADEVFLLNTALHPEGPELSGNETTVIDEGELEVADLSQYHVVVLCNVNRMTEATAARLESFTRSGGGVLFFLGDQVDAGLYNRLLHRGGKGLLPARLGDPVVLPAEQGGVPIGRTSTENPSTRRLAEAASALFGSSAVWQWFTCDLSNADTTPSSQTAASSQPEGDGTPRILVQLGDADHSPLLLDKAFGHGRVILCTSSADKEWNNLADHPVYVVLAMELMQYLARPSGDASEQHVGQPIHLALDPTRFGPQAMLRLPTFPATPALRLQSHPDAADGQMTLDWPDTDQPGLYQFELTRSSGEPLIRQVAVNVDAREGDLRRTSRAALLESMGDLKTTYVAGDDLAARSEEQARRELWPFLVALLVGVLMLEQVLAWWFGADRRWRKALQWKPA